MSRGERTRGEPSCSSWYLQSCIPQGKKVQDEATYIPTSIFSCFFYFNFSFKLVLKKSYNQSITLFSLRKFVTPSPHPPPSHNRSVPQTTLGSRVAVEPLPPKRGSPVVFPWPRQKEGWDGTKGSTQLLSCTSLQYLLYCRCTMRDLHSISTYLYGKYTGA